MGNAVVTTTIRAAKEKQELSFAQKGLFVAMSTRAQDPYLIDEETKKVLREEVFPYWEGRSVDEITETRLRDAGLWGWSSESFICDVSIKSQSGGGDTCPGYDVVLVKKGFNGIKAEAEAHLAELSMAGSSTSPPNTPAGRS